MNPSRDRGLVLAGLCAGVASLGYELVWTRMLGLAVGHELIGTLGVLAGFFAGMALGAAGLHRTIVRAADPTRWFVRLELGAAAFACLSPLFLSALIGWIPKWLGPAQAEATVGNLTFTVALAGLCILPGTVCIGASLPALVEARRRLVEDPVEGRGVGRLYAAYTFGGTAGIVLATHVTLAAIGIYGSAFAFAGTGVAAALLARRASRGAIDRPALADAPAVIDCSKDPDDQVVNERWVLLALVFGTGLVGIGFEVALVQVLSQRFENTLYTFADILAVYLVGTASGAALYARAARKAVRGRPALVAGGLLIALALATIVAAHAAAASPAIMDAIAGEGAGYARHLVAEAVVAAVVFAPATLLMGALFSHVVGLLATRGIGRAYALNALGSAIAPIAFGLWVIPEFGYRDGVFVVVYGYLVLFGAFAWLRRFPRGFILVPLLGVVALTAAGPRSLVLVEPDEGWVKLHEKQSAMGLVIVSEQTDSRQRMRRLQIGKFFRMGGALAIGERRLGHIPLLLRPHAESVLYLGVGTGATLSAAKSYDVERVDAVELVPEILDTLDYFREINGDVARDPRFTFHPGDARRFVAATDASYDLIVGDLFHPARDGAGSLYSKEHFENVREHLRPGGLFAQWIPLYQFDEATLQTVVHTFVDVFDEVHSFLGIYNVQVPAIALIGRAPFESGAPLRVDLDALAERLQKPLYGPLALIDARDLFGAYLLDRAALLAWSESAPLNTDSHPRVLVHAPRAAYVEDEERGWRNLEALLAHRVPVSPELVVTDDPARVEAFLADVERFAAGLEHYLRGKHIHLRAGDANTVPPDAIASFLAAYDVAPEFGPAKGALFGAASRQPEQTDPIFTAMLRRTPKDRSIYQTYIAVLEHRGDRDRLEQVMEMAERELE